MELWLPPSFNGKRQRGGNLYCRICNSQKVDELHIAQCYRRNEEIRLRNPQAHAIMAHPEPDLERFMQEQGGLNRTKGRGPISVSKEIES